MNSSRLLLATVALTVLIAAALASFASQTLPRAVRGQLVRAGAAGWVTETEEKYRG